jgi:hypothetical protein
VGVRLDWQIESERAYERAGEDPSERRRRRMQRLRILLFTAGIASSICIVAALVWLRLYTVDNKLRQDLITTVQTETSTLRIGDLAGFIAIQRTAPGGNWYEDQMARFHRYQDLKTNSEIKLTGNVVDAIVDGSRGRAIVEEVVNGVPYHTVWFYWRYGDGWRHVPSDYTFWGDPATITGKQSVLKYNQLDGTLATALAPLVDRWWVEGCSYLKCQTTQKLSLEIISVPLGESRWEQDRPNTLIVPSPLAIDDRVRSDRPVPPELLQEIATKLSERLFSITTNGLQSVQTSDAAWLQQEIISWLAATFLTGGNAQNVGNAEQLSFIQSLKDHYGSESLALIAHAMTAKSDISMVSKALKQPLDTLALDWRTFFQRRLDVEKTLLARNDFGGFQALWDLASPQSIDLMKQRQLHQAQATPQVQAVAISLGPDGIPRAVVQTAMENKPQTVIFRLVDGSWKRSQ